RLNPLPVEFRRDRQCRVLRNVVEDKTRVLAERDRDQHENLRGLRRHQKAINRQCALVRPTDGDVDAGIAVSQSGRARYEASVKASLAPLVATRYPNHTAALSLFLRACRWEPHPAWQVNQERDEALVVLRSHARSRSCRCRTAKKCNEVPQSHTML